MRNFVFSFSMILLVATMFSCGKDTADNEKFLGKFVGNVSCVGEEFPTTIDVSAKGDSGTNVNLSMDSDGDLVSMTGTVTGSNIVADKVEVEDDTFLSGTGSIAGNSLTITFTVESGSEKDICTFVGTK